jgi:hypothetical protein
MGRTKKRENRTKKKLIERAETVGPLVQSAIAAKEAVVAKRTELNQFVKDELAPVLAAEQDACEALYEATLVETKFGSQPEELKLTRGKGRDRRKVIMRAVMREIKQKDGRRVLKEQATDKDGNPLVDGNNEPIMVPIILRTEYDLEVIEEREPDRIEINLG